MTAGPDIPLRDGTTTGDIRLDRLIQFDERSRLYNISERLGQAPIRGYTWVCRPTLDQGQEGACVGFGWSHEIAAYPKVSETSNEFARHLYWDAQRVDPWEGGSYTGASPVYEGTSVLAGAQVLKARGYIEEYRWAFSVDDVLRALSHEGPVVIGVPWMDSMHEPDPDGLLDISGVPIGGHCCLVRGHQTKRRLRAARRYSHVVRIRNSWGPDWGVGGDGFLEVHDLERLLRMGGEACVPIGRRKF